MQANIVRCQRTKFLKIQNWLILHGVEQFLGFFKHLNLQGILNPFVNFWKYFRKFLENPKLTNTVRSQTLPKLTLHRITN